MLLGTAVSILGKARQTEHYSRLEKTIGSYAVASNVWLTFLCFTEYTFPVGCGSWRVLPLECPWLLPVNCILCVSTAAIAAAIIGLVALAPNKDRKGMWAMGASGLKRDRIFAVGYNGFYLLQLIVYAFGNLSIACQIPSIESWRTLLASSPELVNAFANTAMST